MSGAASPARWRVLFSRNWLAWHAFSIVAVIGMCWLGDWQFHRALGGNALSWAYTFEWPLFAGFGLIFWIKTIVDQVHPRTEPAPGQALQARRVAGIRLPAHRSQSVAVDDEPDPELDEYNAYLARLGQRDAGLS